MEHLLGCDKRQLYLAWEEELVEPEAYEQLIQAREKKMPIAYLTGKKEFMGLSFQVDARVLIPRPETELLVEKVLEDCRQRQGEIRILDIGCGSGAIALSLAHYLPNSSVFALDYSEEALAVTKSNAAALGVLERITLWQGDLWQAVPGGCALFEVIVSNPPYITAEEMRALPEEVARYEPHLALEAKKNGLDFYQKIIDQLETYLLPGGMIAFEVGWKQAAEVAWLLMMTNIIERTEIRKDYAGIERMVLGWREK